MTSRRGFLGALAGALVLDPERALWVPGAKKIFLSPAPRVVRPMFTVGDVVRFGREPQRFVCMNAGDPKDGLGATFAFLHGFRLPPSVANLDPSRYRPPALDFARRPAGHYGFRSLYPPTLVLKG